MKNHIIELSNKHHITVFQYDDNMSEHDNLKSLTHLLFLMNADKVNDDNYRQAVFDDIKGMLNDDQLIDIVKADCGVMIKTDINEYIK